MNEESRLSGETETAKSLPATATKASVKRNSTSVDIQTDVPDILDHVLVAVVQTGDDRYRRRVFLTLKSAERSVLRAREAGHEAEVVLCELRVAGDRHE